MNTDCHDSCGEIASQRLRYFTGRFLTARDVRDEQAYHRSHRYLHNRMLHGWGVVCGLHVRPHPNSNCATDHVRVDCGLALDCCGHELPLDTAQVPPPIPWTERPATSSETPAESRYYPLLCLEYWESEIERVPVLYNEQNCDPQRREFSRYQEGSRFTWHWVRPTDLPQFHWKTPGGACPDPKQTEGGSGPPCPEDDCDDPGKGPTQCCLDPQCPPHHCVPLAFIRVEPGSPIALHNIQVVGRPTLEPPRHALTHICHINWPHGGVVSRRQLQEHLQALRVHFDRRLRHQHSRPGFCGPHGINPCTFVVQFGGNYEDLDFVTYTKAPHLEHDCVAVFTIDPRSSDYRQEAPYAYLENQTVFIALKCDFLLDCHGVAVDGNHLGGVLPSGDGVPGGTFESWFRVVPDHEYDRYQKELKQQAQTEQTL
jgi:hypothetical protein